MRHWSPGLLLLAAACQTAHPLPRVEVPPPAPMPASAPAPATPTDEAATRAWLDREIAAQRGESKPQAQQAPAMPPAAPTDEQATHAWLERTIEERRAAAPDRPPEPLYQYVPVEKTVYVDRPVYVERTVYAAPVVRYECDPYWGYECRPTPRCTEPFPVNTALGAGVGAVIGYQSHRAWQGAAIGGGIGLLLDLGRWCR